MIHFVWALFDSLACCSCLHSTIAKIRKSERFECRFIRNDWSSDSMPLVSCLNCVFCFFLRAFRLSCCRCRFESWVPSSPLVSCWCSVLSPLVSVVACRFCFISSRCVCFPISVVPCVCISIEAVHCCMLSRSSSRCSQSFCSSNESSFGLVRTIAIACLAASSSSMYECPKFCVTYESKKSASNSVVLMALFLDCPLANT